MVARALVGLVALVVVADAPAALPGGRAVVVTSSVTPDTHLFADAVRAQVDVVVDPALLDPDRLRLRLDFAPYEPVSRPTETRATIGSLVRIRYVADLHCLEVECLGPRVASVLGPQEAGRPERHTVRFGSADLLYERAGGAPELLLRRELPPVEVLARVNTAALAAAQETGALLGYRASLDPPPPTYRVDPRVLAAALLAGAALLLLLPLALAGRIAHARLQSLRRQRRLTPLGRALLLVERTSGEDRRKALEALAQVLDDEGAQRLAAKTRAVAWDEHLPPRTKAAELAAIAAGGDRDA